jgi:hypothetical protein
METHKFKFGQPVEFIASDLRSKPLGIFKVVRVMPSERGIQQYRVKSDTDGHERVAMGSDLVASQRGRKPTDSRSNLLSLRRSPKNELD